MFEEIREIENESNLSYFGSEVDLSPSLFMSRVADEIESLWLILFVYIDRMFSE